MLAKRRGTWTLGATAAAKRLAIVGNIKSVAANRARTEVIAVTIVVK